MTKKIMLCIMLWLFSYATYAQYSGEYTDWIKKAMGFYEAKQYQQSAEAFSHAFKSIGWKGSIDDLYNAGCSWAQAGNKDSAFAMLNKIAAKGNYSDLNHMATDADLVSLHSDPRWQGIYALVKQNKDKLEVNWNKPLAASLDTIFQNDQQIRMQVDNIQQKYGPQSNEMKALWKKISAIDSIDLIKIIAILDHYGWPGPELVGEQGNETVFLVIQHADLKTQDKYLPMMREAVKNSKAAPANLALLEDRVALGHGKKQIYGSQITTDEVGNFLSPLEDPDNVDKRGAKVGLGPIAEYLNYFQIKWNLAAYKKDLPEIEKREKKKINSENNKD